MYDVSAVVFDFDGTLAELNVDFRRMRTRVLESIRSHGEYPESFEELFALEMVAGASRMIAARNPAEADEFRRQAMEIIREAEMEGAARGNIFDGIPAMFLDLRERNIRTAVVTRNCREAVCTIYPAIEDHADLLVARDGIIRVKPDPGHLLAALERLEVPSGKAFMVGDHPMDIETGKAAGTFTAGVLTGLSSRESLLEAGCDVILDRAAHIADILKDVPR
ncbi:MAG: HAD family hydrolase [Syntrophales bacterium]|nr:HAD family hydrolase [Syntrophales bacterium]MCK9528060.1 HAD family hydrolase [Syntrophales bacterium]MDX9922344.1 HAD family hydrolase [Syntrophales bacterium]